MDEWTPCIPRAANAPLAKGHAKVQCRARYLSPMEAKYGTLLVYIEYKRPGRAQAAHVIRGKHWNHNRKKKHTSQRFVRWLKAQSMCKRSQLERDATPSAPVADGEQIARGYRETVECDTHAESNVEVLVDPTSAWIATKNSEYSMIVSISPTHRLRCPMGGGPSDESYHRDRS